MSLASSLIKSLKSIHENVSPDEILISYLEKKIPKNSQLSCVDKKVKLSQVYDALLNGDGLGKFLKGYEYNKDLDKLVSTIMKGVAESQDITVKELNRQREIRREESVVKTDSVKNWFSTKYPKKSSVISSLKDITFEDLYNALNDGYYPYEVIYKSTKNPTSEKISAATDIELKTIEVYTGKNNNEGNKLLWSWEEKRNIRQQEIQNEKKKDVASGKFNYSIGDKLPISGRKEEIVVIDDWEDVTSKNARKYSRNFDDQDYALAYACKQAERDLEPQIVYGSNRYGSFIWRITPLEDFDLIYCNSSVLEGWLVTPTGKCYRVRDSEYLKK